MLKLVMMESSGAETVQAKQFLGSRKTLSECWGIKLKEGILDREMEVKLLELI